jgi:SAM-dependent methyltransferase
MTDECKICGGSNLFPHNYYGTECLECRTCGIVYRIEMPTQRELDTYYGTQYNIASPDSVATEQRRLFRMPEQFQLISEIRQYVEPPALIADVGCDKGFFLDEARRWGYRVVGAELSESGRQYCRNVGLGVVGSISELPGNIDAVVMWHSLEHFIEPVNILRKLSDLLNPGGYLFVRVPAFDSVWRSLFGNRWIWFQPENHYFHYNINSLIVTLQKSGFEVVSVAHRKPNTRHTRRTYSAAAAVMNNYFGVPRLLRNYIKRKYEDITGVEIFAIARKK